MIINYKSISYELKNLKKNRISNSRFFTSLSLLPGWLCLLQENFFLNFRFFIKFVKVVDNNWNGQGNTKNSTNCTNLEKKGNCLILQLISTFQTKHRKERICQNHHKHEQCYNSSGLSKKHHDCHPPNHLQQHDDHTAPMNFPNQVTGYMSP